MNDTISWNLRLQIADGKLDDVKALADEMSEATRLHEPGALAYEWFITDDGTQCHINERYVDDGATMTHLGNFGSKFAGRFMEILTPISFDVYGTASDAVREGLAGLGAVHVQQVSGFAR
jgi:quinol monooxygenase YgiN